jgi:surface protein
LNAPNNWVLSDGGQEAPFEFTVKTDNAGVSTSTQFRMPLTTSTNLGFTVNWGDGSPLETITDHTLAIHDYGTAGTYTISVTGAILGWQFNGGGDRLKMLDVKQWSGLNISVSDGFEGCGNFGVITATDAPLITSSGSLQRYFRSSSFNGNISSWDVSIVSNFSEMFEFSSFNNGGSPDINNWQIRNNTSVRMSKLFKSCPFNQPIGNWDTSSVVQMDSMFTNNSAFNQYIGNWNTSNVSTMFVMFQGTSSFNQNISTKTINTGLPNEYIAWDTSNVTNMQGMFASATAFNQDIGNWNVSNVTNFGSFMLNKTAANYSAQNLASIYNQWSQLTLKPNLTITFNTIDYCDTAEANKQSIITNFGWNITDGSAVPC